jgi:hypothetical protein
MIYKLTAVTGVNTVISVDVREDDTIEGVFIDHSLANPSDGSELSTELSFLSTSSRNISDTTGVIAEMASTFELMTSGAAFNSRSAFIHCQIPIAAGERLYLHHMPTGMIGATSSSRVFIYTSKKQENRATRRR